MQCYWSQYSFSTITEQSAIHKTAEKTEKEFEPQLCKFSGKKYEPRNLA
jgi:hypothetical protein